METVRVLQLGAEDFSEKMQVSDCAEWYYEPDFTILPEKDYDVVILDREITEGEFDYLIQVSKAYCLFLTESVSLKKSVWTRRFFKRKMGKRISDGELQNLLNKDLPDYFPNSYGEKYILQNLSVAQGFDGSVSWRGFEGIDLVGNYGEYLKQIVFWRINIPIAENQSIDYWLEYAKDDTVEIALEITLIQFGYGTDPIFQKVLVFSEKELEDIVCVENESEALAYAFASLKAKGHGRLTVTALHDRYSRKGKGNFMPGGRRAVTSEREEVFYYFDPGNLKPPLNVYFSGYKTQEGFEGYYMIRKMGHPFLLISESRLEGGAFYLGTEEYENMIEQIIRDHMTKLGFRNSEVILSGLSMGAFGALYYGCRIHPNTILVGKPLASLGDMAENERIRRPDVFPTSLDVLHKSYGSLSQEAVQKLNDRYWNAFDQSYWNETRFAIAYMIEDDYDGTAYEKLQSHLKDTGSWIYGKGLHGRHNDDTSGIVAWFVNQYRKILQNDFGEESIKQAGRDHDR